MPLLKLISYIQCMIYCISNTVLKYTQVTTTGLNSRTTARRVYQYEKLQTFSEFEKFCLLTSFAIIKHVIFESGENLFGLREWAFVGPRVFAAIPTWRFNLRRHLIVAILKSRLDPVLILLWEIREMKFLFCMKYHWMADLRVFIIKFFFTLNFLATWIN